MTFYGILMLAQKSASQFGDGEGALAMWKNSITDYNDTNKVCLAYHFKIVTTYFVSRNTAFVAIVR